MRLIPTHLCMPGMRLAKKIYSEEGQVLLTEHSELTSKIIRRLSDFGVHFIYIEDPRTSDLQVPDLISEETRRKALSEIRTQFRQLMNRSNQRSTAPYPYIAKPFREVMELVLDDLLESKDGLIMLMNMGIVDDYLYQHSLNVCIYSTMLGIASGYSRAELMNLGMGAMLHDVGKTQISVGVLKKPGSLTREEYEEMKRHAERGYLLLKDEPNIPLLVAHCAFQHHERIDGSGYPRGIAGDNIHEYAKWIGLVDSYDAMTTMRVYRTPMLPHEAMEALYAGSGTMYEQRMLQCFRDKVAIYPIGVTVKLGSGEIGVVSRLNDLIPHRPVVRVLYDQEGQEVAVPYEVDLSTAYSSLIISVGDEQQLREATS
ncbi:HD-GYP domain-containing protein (c-di-GMP phosphodiesterase class II) [Paenibacillus phyllosphaerae]|uniref:HD-GYP domain-containing protein (C-di-GMP phosphodiesterase class II) n=1 Tax=Paenibacillus phyllosphaerae TaxID=274593 RepID=A0A7W5FKT1_9BACL|nr:HD-GYP domain-containing protein [Paenibacillus phyllosphaerae]MBB3108299.1 HD-GYP domain-containing protein (c-di-GMP phosphodiesterase class II) [Paenibacillus phyllosphaerae]